MEESHFDAKDNAREVWNEGDSMYHREVLLYEKARNLSVRALWIHKPSECVHYGRVAPNMSVT